MRGDTLRALLEAGTNCPRCDATSGEWATCTCGEANNVMRDNAPTFVKLLLEAVDGAERFVRAQGGFHDPPSPAPCPGCWGCRFLVAVDSLEEELP